MMKLYDASAIMNLLTDPKRVSVLAGNSVLDLTLYEIGNAIWKKMRADQKPLTDCIIIMQHVLIILKSMKSLNVLNVEQDVLTVADKYNMTYYDTAYMVVAMKNNLELVTDDKKMKKSAIEYGIDVYSSDAVSI